MNLEHRVRALAGSLILIGIGLSFLLNAFFIFVPVLVAADLLQSAFSGHGLVDRFLATLGESPKLPATSAR